MTIHTSIEALIPFTLNVIILRLYSFPFEGFLNSSGLYLGGSFLDSLLISVVSSSTSESSPLSFLDFFLSLLFFVSVFLDSKIFLIFGWTTFLTVALSMSIDWVSAKIFLSIVIFSSSDSSGNLFSILDFFDAENGSLTSVFFGEEFSPYFKRIAYKL